MIWHECDYFGAGMQHWAIWQPFHKQVAGKVSAWCFEKKAQWKRLGSGLWSLCCMLESPFWIVSVQVPSCNLQSSAVGYRGKNATCKSCFQHCIGIKVESKHHGMVGVEGTLKPIQIQPHTKSWVMTPPDQAIQKLSNLALSTSGLDEGIHPTANSYPPSRHHCRRQFSLILPVFGERGKRVCLWEKTSHWLVCLYLLDCCFIHFS